ncbi:MAG: TrmO family methyltransferase [Candidatus Spechtbacterales bacterium]|nr:TrmO family methyltransferase [Candidatus Spechtbacterales bacterium]
MDLADILSIVAIVVLTPTTIAQIYANYKRKSAEGVSTITFVCLFAGLAIFFVVSIITPTHIAISINYLIGVMGSSIVLFQKYYYRKNNQTSNPDSEVITMNPIGEVQNDIFSRTKDLKWRDVYSEIVLNEDLEGSLDGLDGYSHAYILFYFSELSEDDKVYGKLQPYGFEDLPPVGIFATRMRQRPNLIACSLVLISKVEGTKLIVKGLDAFHGTPILDIKPFTGPPRDVPGGCALPLWAQRVNKPR